MISGLVWVACAAAAAAAYSASAISLSFGRMHRLMRGCQSVCVRGLIYKYAVNLSG